jgi:predicted nucleotidyltransferase
MDAQLQADIQAAAACLRSHGAIEVYVFGSAVTGRLRVDSDVDLAVTGLPAQVFFRAIADASRILGRTVDLVSLDREDDVAIALLESGNLRPVGPDLDPPATDAR